MVSNCPFLDLCQFCNNYFFGICCLRKTYKKRDFKKCIEIGICPNLYVCRDAINGKLSRISLFNTIIPSLGDIKSFEYMVKKPFEMFNNRFLPRIEVFGRNFKNQMKIVKKLEINFIAVSLADFISNIEGEILKENFMNNLHDRLDFDGKILLQTNIPDCYCIKIMENHLRYIDAINCLKPDIITTFDANFYLDQPLFINSIQIINILNSNLLISELDIPQIFLLPPVPLPLFKSIFEVFLKSNHASICIPVAEFSKSKNRYILKLLKYINSNRDKSDKEFELLLISKSPDIKMYADCYSSNAWTRIKERNSEEDYLNKMERKLQRTIQNANEMKFQKTLFSYLGMV